MGDDGDVFDDDDVGAVAGSGVTPALCCDVADAKVDANDVLAPAANGDDVDDANIISMARSLAAMPPTPPPPLRLLSGVLVVAPPSLLDAADTAAWSRAPNDVSVAGALAG